jgi:hypothetical protein
LSRVPQGPLLLLSPHFDDAALSCSGLLERDEPVDVLTVFAGRPQPPRQGPWDAACGFADSDVAGATREAEERQAFAGSPHRLATLPLIEAQYTASPRGPAETAPLVDAVRDWLAHAGGGTVAVPAGAGAPWGRRGFYARVRRRLPPRSSGLPPHPDHLLLRDTIVPHLRGAEDAVTLLYEEIPYCFGAAADGAAKRIADANASRATLLTLGVDREAKAARIASYRSQLWSFPPELLDADTLSPTERYWLLEPT